MKERYLHIVAKFGVIESQLAVVKIQSFADLQTGEVERVCKKCGMKPQWTNGFYRCPQCGETYGHWSALRMQDPTTHEEIVKERLIPEKAEVKAEAFVMGIEEFAKYCDATLGEYGVTIKNEQDSINLRNLLVAVHSLNKVIIIVFKDTYEERIALLTTSLSGRVILKEIIPINLAVIKQTLTVNLRAVTPEEIAQAEQLIKMLPPATEETLKVKDYRTKGEVKPKVSEKTEALEEIIKKLKEKKALEQVATQST
jgi:hypothetical protein